jgi:galactose mutarotase-like enzyme
MSLLTIGKGDTIAVISDDGGWLKKFSVRGKDVLVAGFEYEKEGKIKKRGGVPILFPNAGQEIKSDLFNLSQHGFARDMVWEITKHSEDKLILQLVGTVDTFKLYPFHFQSEVSFSVSENCINISLSVLNTGQIDMPLAPGFHPYFNLLKENRDKLVLKQHSFVFDGTTAYKNSKSPINFELPEIGEISLSYSDNLKNVSYWAELSGNYICIEPWVGTEGAILDESALVNLKPQQIAIFNMDIKVLL